MKTDNKRSGSALVIVLGMLSVMMLMAVAFATFMRTEQAGTTNLKNGHVARQSLSTALGRVIEAVDMSFDSPTNDWAAPIWPEPWLASSGSRTNDYLQSARLAVKGGRNDSGATVSDHERVGAQLLTYEMTKYLTPAQIAMARSAKVDWAPIHSSIKVSDPIKNRPSGVNLYGDLGRPGEDTIIGRYAFLVLPTTGLLDPNLSFTNGTPNTAVQIQRRRFVSDPSAYILPTADAKFENAPGSGEAEAVEVPRTIDNAAQYLDKRKQSGGSFVSFADIRLQLEDKRNSTVQLGGRLDAKGSSGALDLLWPSGKSLLKDAQVWNKSNSSVTRNSFFPADQVGGFSMALEGLDPDGFPRLHLPTEDELKGKNGVSKLSSAEMDRFAARALVNMGKVFARSRKSAGLSSGEVSDSSKDELTFYEAAGSSKKITVSKARLATVAMLDAMDEDLVPGKADLAGWSKKNIWSALPSVSSGRNDDDPNRVADSKPGSTDPLDFPATEPVPLLSHTWAYVTWESCTTNWYCTGRGNSFVEGGLPPYNTWKTWIDPAAGGFSSRDFEKWAVVYKGRIHAGAAAAFYNQAPEWKDFPKHKYTMTMDWDVMSTWPAENSVSRSSGKNTIVPLFEDGDLISWGPAKPAPAPNGWLRMDNSNPFIGPTAPDRSYSAVKKGLAIKGAADAPSEVWIGVSSDGNANSKGFSNDSTTGGDPVFYVLCSLDADKSTLPRLVDSDGDGTVDSWSEPKFVFPPPTNAEYENGDDQDVWLPIRMKVTIKDENTGDIVQQVPAPRIDGNDKAYWIGMDAYVWHGDKSKHFQGDTMEIGKLISGAAASGKTQLDAKQALGWGWAMCTVPQFGMDTTCLVTHRENDGGMQRNYPGTMYWINNRITRDESILSDDVKWIKKFRKEIDENACDDLEEPQQLTIPLNEFQQNWIFGDNPRSSPDFSFWLDAVFTGSADKNYVSRPDFLHRWAPGDGPNLDVSDGSLMSNKNADVVKALRSRIANGKAFRSPADLGNVMCGPYETLSLYRTYRPKAGGAVPTYRADFHPVFDYFASSQAQDRYPTYKDYSDSGEMTETSGENGFPKQLAYSALLPEGRVNLNAPGLVHLESRAPLRATEWVHGSGRTYNALQRFVPNLYPYQSALIGAPYQAEGFSTGTSGSAAPKQLDEKQAAAVAVAMHKAIEETAVRHGSIRFATPTDKDDFEDAGWPMARSLSDCLGTADKETSLPNPLLEMLMTGNLDHFDSNYSSGTSFDDLATDADREALLANIGDSFATRGQTFLAIIRADAYTPKFGEEESTADGNSLATTHALVELWRDPEPARTADGLLPEVDGKPYAFHNWYIRSFRVF